MSSTVERARRRYKKPPVSQVICEFQFVGVSAWDWTIPGLIYQEIGSAFPEKRQEKGVEVRITPHEEKVEQVLPSTLTKMQFLNASKSAMVQIGPDLLAVNILSGYPGWEGFRDLVQGQFNIYNRIARPVGFKRIGLRYINRIQFSGPRIELTDYFNYYPQLPASIEQVHGPFSMQVTHFYDDGRDAMSLRMGNALPLTPDLVIVLDLDYYLQRQKSVELVDGRSWIEQAHDRVETMFEACVTDGARELFEVIS